MKKNGFVLPELAVTAAIGGLILLAAGTVLMATRHAQTQIQVRKTMADLQLILLKSASSPKILSQIETTDSVFKNCVQTSNCQAVASSAVWNPIGLIDFDGSPLTSTNPNQPLLYDVNGTRCRTSSSSTTCPISVSAVYQVQPYPTASCLDPSCSSAQPIPPASTFELLNIRYSITAANLQGVTSQAAIAGSVVIDLSETQL